MFDSRSNQYIDRLVLSQKTKALAPIKRQNILQFPKKHTVTTNWSVWHTTPEHSTDQPHVFLQMLFHASFNLPHQTFCSGLTIEQAESVKNLCVVIDSRFNWDLHIAQRGKKVAWGSGELYKLQPYIDVNLLCKVYFSIVYCQLFHAIVTWGIANAVVLDCLVNWLTELWAMFAKFTSVNKTYKRYASVHLYTGDKKT